ncbi:MAG TPA: carboxypeptidase regulatory-like domain-containing protein [Candidatus Babeliales bacterium]|nr:carboxypeptidase regulatory-like domain-containing protein [Candidatus Babeliales bacterium]
MAQSLAFLIVFGAIGSVILIATKAATPIIGADDFNRADSNPVSGNWDTLPGTYPMQIISGQLASSNGTQAPNCNATVNNWSLWKDTVPSDVGVEVAVAAKGATHEPVDIRLYDLSMNLQVYLAIYPLDYPMGSTIFLNGVTSPITGYPYFPVNTGDKIGLRISGTTVEVTNNGNAIYTRTLLSTSVNPRRVVLGSHIECFHAGGGLRLDDFRVTSSSSPPSAPSNLSATPVSEGQINLSWTASNTDSGTISGYQIYRNNTLLKTVTSTTYNSTGLSSSTNYSYYVKAVATSGLISSPSDTVSATTKPLTRTISDAMDDDPVVPLVNDPTRGLIWDGIKPGTGACADTYEINDDQGNQLSCTHGPDPTAPDLVNPLAGQTLDSIGTVDKAPNNVACIGDGYSGYRVQLLYAHAVDVPDRYFRIRNSLLQYAYNMNNMMLESSKNTRSIRFVTQNISDNPRTCEPDIQGIGMPAVEDDSFANTIKYLRATGKNDPKTKYVVWVDTPASNANMGNACGIADWRPDSRKAQDNDNNGYFMQFAVAYQGCWGGATEAHEFMHTLGGVQNDSPNASGGDHCNDGYDIMCYNDHGSTSSYTIRACPSYGNSHTYDCHRDDYFNASPAVAGSNYLSNHWNTANSRFLVHSQSDDTLKSVTDLVGLAASPTQVNISWGPSPGATGYAIYRNGDPIATVDGNTLSYGDTSLHQATSYSYTVLAIDPEGNYSSVSNVNTVVTSSDGTTDTMPPIIASGIKADVAAANQINLTWPFATDNVAVTGYNVYRNNTKIASIPSSASADLDSNTVYFGDSGALAKTNYTYWIQAYDAAGNQSTISNKVAVTTPSVTAGLGSVTGRVTDINGSPLASVKVSYTLNGAAKSVSTSSSGYYVISSLPAGKQTLSLAYTGYRSKTIAPKVLANANKIGNFNLRKLAAISGTVTDQSTGKPLASVVISYQLGGATKTVKTNSNGKYSITDLPAEIKISGTNYNITYNLNGYQSQTKSVTVHLDQSSAQDISLSK